MRGRSRLRARSSADGCKAAQREGCRAHARLPPQSPVRSRAVLQPVCVPEVGVPRRTPPSLHVSALLLSTHISRVQLGALVRMPAPGDGAEGDKALREPLVGSQRHSIAPQQTPDPSLRINPLLPERPRRRGRWDGQLADPERRGLRRSLLGRGCKQTPRLQAGSDSSLLARGAGSRAQEGAGEEGPRCSEERRMKSAGSTPLQAAGLSSTRRLFPPRSLLASFSRGKQNIAVCGPMCQERCHGEERWDRALTPRWASGAAKGHVLPTGSSSATLGREAQAGRWGLSAALRPAAAPRPPKSRGEAASCPPSTPRWSSKHRPVRAVPPFGARAARCRRSQPRWVRLPLPLPFPPPQGRPPLPAPLKSQLPGAGPAPPLLTRCRAFTHGFPSPGADGAETQGWDGGVGKGPQSALRAPRCVHRSSIHGRSGLHPLLPPLFPSRAGWAQSTEQPHKASPRLRARNEGL